MTQAQPFVFYTERRLVILTGLKARNLAEFLSHLRQVSGSSIFYHTHHQYLAHHFEKPLFHSDFALWASHALLEERLSERLAAIDLRAFTSIRQLRTAIVATVESYLVETGEKSHDCQSGQEFNFCESMSFVMPTSVIALDPPDFFAKMPRVSNVSLYFHFMEARLRLEHPTNDFSNWLSGLGEESIAREIDELDPYPRSLDELRAEIIEIGRTRGISNDRNTAGL